jgi:hypothetical protein
MSKGRWQAGNPWMFCVQAFGGWLMLASSAASAFGVWMHYSGRIKQAEADRQER